MWSVSLAPFTGDTIPDYRRLAVNGEERWHIMDADTPITLATARYENRELAVEDYERVWSARKHDQFDHTAVTVLTKDADGKLKIDRHDSSTKHLAWAGAAAAVLVPGVGVAAGAGAGAITGHFWHNIPKAQVREAGELLESGESGLIVVAVNKEGTDIEPLLALAEKTSVMETVAGNLQSEIDKELSEAQAAEDQS
jgi:uncharacterized membrane protein